MSGENRFASLYDEEEEVAPVVKETKTEKKPRGNEKRVANLRPGKREFERHSGTGRGREIPKNGSGNRNWGNPKDVNEQLRAETEPLETSPVEEAEEKETEPRPEVFTLEEYEAMRKAKLGNLPPKKAPRTVEAPTTEKIEKIEEDLFVAEGIKKKERKVKAEEKPTEVILNFQAVEGTPRNFVPRERRRFEERREGNGNGEHKRGEGRNGERRGERRGQGRNGERRGPKLNLKSEALFPKL